MRIVYVSRLESSCDELPDPLVAGKGGNGARGAVTYFAEGVYAGSHVPEPDSDTIMQNSISKQKRQKDKTWK